MKRSLTQSPGPAESLPERSGGCLRTCRRSGAGSGLSSDREERDPAAVSAEPGEGKPVRENDSSRTSE